MPRLPALPAFAVAVLAGVLLATAADAVALAAVAALMAAAIAFVPGFRRVRAALLIGALSGIASVMLRPDTSALVFDARTSIVAGTIVEKQSRVGGGAAFTIERADGLRLRGIVRAPVRAGDCAIVRGRPVPFDEPRNPGEPSLRALENEAGIAGAIDRAHLVATAACSPWNGAAWMPRVRTAASDVVHAALPAIPAAILAGALWGERGALPADLAQAFQDTGTVHVLVTAGLHLGVLAALATWCFTRLGMHRAVAAAATIALVWSYAAASGAHLPSLRAATMLTFACTAYALGRRPLSWNAYFAAVAVVALAWPTSVRSVSFALSFSCVAAILLFARPIAERLETARIPAVVREPIALTVATQIGVWPLTAATFLLVTPYAVLANLVVVPGIALAMVLGFAVFAAQPLPMLAAACATIDAALLAAIAATVRAVAALPFAHVAVAPPSAWAIVVYDVAAVGAAAFVRAKRVVVACGVLVVATLLVAASAQRYDATLRVTMLDVGQGDGILVQTPAGHAFLIDTGGALERGTTDDGRSPAEAVGERIVVPAVLRAGVTHLDGIILTHPHGDHKDLSGNTRIAA